MQSEKTTFIVISAVLGMLVAIVWFGAPLVPAVIGATGAGALIYWKLRRPR